MAPCINPDPRNLACEVSKRTVCLAATKRGLFLIFAENESMHRPLAAEHLRQNTCGRNAPGGGRFSAFEACQKSKPPSGGETPGNGRWSQVEQMVRPIRKTQNPKSRPRPRGRGPARRPNFFTPKSLDQTAPPPPCPAHAGFPALRLRQRGGKGENQSRTAFRRGPCGPASACARRHWPPRTGNRPRPRRGCRS